MKVPFDKINHPTDVVANRIQTNVDSALDKLGSQTLDHWDDGKTFRKVVGVNFAHQVTASGIAPYSILAVNVASGTLLGKNIAPLTISGANLAPATVTIDKLGSANQFSAYRVGAFTCPAGVYSAFYFDTVMKDLGNGANTASAWYQLPADGDYQFQWSLFINSSSAASTRFLSKITINSGDAMFGSDFRTTAAGQAGGSVGSYLYCNGKSGDRVKVSIFNGDGSPQVLLVGSGNNVFQAFQVR